MSDVTILQVVPRLETGGSEQSTVEIAAALTQAGAKALVATEGGRLATALTEAGGEMIALPVASKNPLTVFANARRLARIVEERDVALLHARSRAPAWSAYLAARRTGRPFVTTYHGAYSGRSRLKTFYNSVMARGDQVIANSNFTAGLINSQYPVAPDRLHVIYRGFDVSAFDADNVAPERVARLRQTWRLDDSQRVVLQAARLTRWKGHRYTIDAARQLRDRGQLGDTVFILAGDAQGREGYRAELLAKIDAVGLQDAVRLVGHCDDIPAAFTLADVAIIASTRAETFGRTSIESQAAGCPVIVSDVGAASENVVPRGAGDGFTGWVTPAADAPALAARLSEALNMSPEALAAIGQRAGRHVRARFALQDMQRATLGVYDKLLGTELAARFNASSQF
ncbi:MAG: glycosyltransferase family 4 protein [Methyloceanibacter sp.]|nr:glycosyltransferase family 4 protein [Methyloceanibacter sp.]